MTKTNIVDMYGLSPLQHGILMHTLQAPRSGVYLEQFRVALGDGIDEEAFRRAWQRVVDQHAILRTSFFWEDLEKPLQVVHEVCELPTIAEDWRGLAPQAVAQRLEAYLTEDRRRGFDFAQAPLIRMALFRTGERSYEFVLTFHHLLLDGWSAALVLRDFAQCYDAFRQGTNPRLLAPPRFRDYILWLERQDLAKAEAFWRTTLDGIVAPTRLAKDWIPGTLAASEEQYKEQVALLSEELTRALQGLARERELTLNTLLQAAWALLLAHYSGDSDVVFGTVSSGRPTELPGVTSMVGLFVNSLPMRVRIEGDEALVDWLARLQAHQVEMREYGYAPLIDIHGWSDVPRRLPLFESLFAFENYPTFADRGPFEATLARDTSIFERTNYPVSVLIGPGTQLTLRMLHDVRCLDEAQARSMLAHYRYLLEQMVAEPRRQLSAFTLVREPERALLLEGWNATGTGYPRDRCVHELFEAWAHQTPDAVAVEYDGQALSYGELNARANRMAHYLLRHGVGAETLVGLCLPRGLEMVVATLGILKAGGAYVPLDPEYPAARLRFMLEDTGAPVLLTQASLRERLPRYDGRVVCVDAQWEEIGRESEADPKVAVGSRNLAYVIYTSGSTGTPKGTCVEHRSIVRLVRDSDYIAITPADRFAQASVVSFDAATFELWGALLNGARAIGVGRELSLSGREFGEFLRTREITVLFLTTALFNQMAREAPGAFGSLRCLLFGGEMVDAEAVRAVLRDGAPRELLHVYGPTEVTTFSTWYRVSALAQEARTVPIGRPIANTTAYVLNGHLQPVPVGVPGELYLGGDGLARGYLKRPELTAERFVEHPFSAEAGARLYRTGDLVRRLGDGNIEFLGRQDGQVKVRGFRIELGEIEAVLLRHPAVRQAVAMVREDVPGDKRVVAYVVANEAALNDVAHGEDSAGWREEHVAEWRELYEQTYARSTHEDAAFDITGWNSSYTAAPIPAEEMREWVAATVERIAARSPRRVLEIGCGTGLLLARLAPACEVYRGTDFSSVALEQVRKLIASRADLAHVELSQRLADDFSGIEPGTYDTVVINSVSQYLPNVEYLETVLQGAVAAVRPGGRIFVGDVRSLPLLRAFHTSVQCHRADLRTAKGPLAHTIDNDIELETELVVDPEFFLALQRENDRISAVEIFLKRGWHQNELTRFRYDAFVHVEAADNAPEPEAWLDWRKENLNLADLATRLDARPLALGIRSIPNARLQEATRALGWLAAEGEEPRTLEAFRQATAEAPGEAVEPEALWTLAEARGYALAASYSDADPVACMDVLFRRREGSNAAAVFWPQPQPATAKPWSAYANNPLKAKLVRDLTPRLREYASQALPEYMTPSAFVVLDELPLTPNGKLDRRALPAPGRSGSAAGYVAPRTATEEALAGIWAEVLRVDRAGVHDDFFELGGHSLLATQVVSRVRQALKVEMPLRELFAQPTIARLSAYLQSQHPALAAPPLEGKPQAGPAELSFAQQRLWFIDQLDGGGAAYVVAGALELQGTLEASALERALQAIVQRHEALRTVFVAVADEPRQVVIEPGSWNLAVTDLTGQADARERLRERLRDEALRGFDLAHGPLFRAQLYRLEPQRHVLMLTMHHIVSDGWSLGVLMRELGELYKAFARGEAPKLPELRVQYRDYARWQRGWLQGGLLESQLAHWRERLAGAPQVLELPTDRPRPSLESHRGATYAFTLPRELVERLYALSQREGATLFMTLLAGFALLLARYSGQQDLLIGTPVANRNRAEVEPLIGFFVNTLVLRADLSGEPSVRAYLARMREVCLDAYAHQDVPFERLVEDLHPARDLSRNAVFQVMFALQNAPMQELELPGLALRPLELGREIAQFDLSLHTWETPAGLAAGFSYATDLFDASTIARMAVHWRTLLEAMVNRPQAALSELSLLGDAERRRLLVEWNATGRDYAEPHRLHRLIEAQVRRTPDAVALQFEGRALTCAEVNARANRLARVLRRRGVGADVLVGIYAERSFEMVLALLAVLKAGGAYVPLDPEYPPERLGHMMQDAAVALVLAQAHLIGELPPSAAAVLPLDESWAAFAAESGEDLSDEGSEESLAYVIFTSGSTGRPKGAMNTHRAICNRLLWMQEQYGLGAGDAVLQKTPFSFDVSVWELFWPLLSGARLQIARPGGHRDSGYLMRSIEQHAITTLHFVPALLRVFLEEEGLERCRALKRVICSGEALGRDLQQRFHARLPQVELHNLYGPTEAAVDVTFWHCRRDDARSTVPIGRPVANTRIYLLDERMQPVPAGVPGELYIGGVQVGRGYVGRPDLTAERFVPDPFSGRPEARLYRTGDRARWLSEGVLEYLGRLDFQVKIRGQRIELGEIEAVLDRHPAVAQSVVVTRGESAEDQRLAAYVVPRGQAPSLAELKTHLARSLAPYMVPGDYVFLAELPLTASGKIDRKALPAPQRPGRGDAERYVAPRTPIEEAVASIWSQVLQLERVGTEDNFFDLGGHSLLATQVVSRVRKALDVELPLRDLFVVPTVAGLAQRIEALRGGQQPSLMPPALRASTESGPAVLSFAQQRLWFLDRLEPGGATYVIAGALELRGALDASALQRALKTVIERHDSLRTVIQQAEGVPRQVVLSAPACQLPLTDLSVEPEPRRQLAACLHAEVTRGFDLEHGPLFRAQLYRLAPDTHVLQLAMHHIVADGWSLGVLSRELGALYASFAGGKSAGLPALSVQYGDYARWQRAWLRSEVLEQQLAHWSARLAGAAQVLELPTDRPRPPVESHRGAAYEFALPAELVERLRKLSQQEGATLFMTLLAGFAILLARYSGQKDLLIGTPVANRNRAEIEPLIGFFVNTLVLRADLTGAPSVRAFLARMREVCLDAYAHQDLPFEQLVERLQPARDLSRNAVFQVVFGLQNVPVEAMQLPGLEIEPVALESTAAQFDLSLFAREMPDGLVASMSYATDLFDASTIARMAAHWRTLLDSMCATPDSPVERLRLLSDAERSQLLVQWNDTRADYPRNRCVHELFEAQAARTPHAVAVAVGDRRLSYRELDARANRLAWHLRARGVGPDTRVALCVERSLDLAVGLLGILKAGGAYVPLDPGYPPERLAFMAADAQAACVLTQSHLRSSFPVGSAGVVCLDSDWPEIEGLPELAPPLATQPTHLAYVIYTSGSTGAPKGACITHRGLVNYLSWALRACPVTQGTGSPVHSSIAFDLTVTSFFTPLLAGRSVELLPDDQGAEALAEVLAGGARYSLVKLTPAHLQLLQERLAAADLANATYSFVIGGERLDAETVAFWRERAPGTVLVNEYGPTETVVGCCTYTVTDATRRSGPIPIGRPIANTRLYVLDEWLQPVPIGVSGELYIGGDGVARGYLNRAELTAEKFVPDPFDATPGARLYRTGDLVRYLADGNLEFLRRLDDQVKLRGYRIEPGEIEAALTRQAEVRQAAVVLREDTAGDKRLVAYVVARDEAQPELTQRLRSALRASLPPQMVPAAIVVLDALPLTPNGKLDRRALPAPEGSRGESGFVAPRTPDEEIVAGIWAEVLGLDRVGVEDNFFELGGHSLLAVRVIERMRQAGLDADLKALFATSTVAALAASAGGERAAVVVPPNLIPAACTAIEPEMLPLVRLTTEEIARVVSTVAGGAANVQDIYPLGPLQEGILFHHLMTGEGDPYLQYALVRFDTRARLNRYLDGVQAVIARHDILRTAVVWEGLPEPVQVVWRQAPLHVEEVRLDGTCGDAGQELVARFGPRARRLDVREAPLLRGYIVQEPTSARWLMLLQFHHLAVDHVTLEHIQHEVQAQMLGCGEALPAPVAFRNFVAQARLGFSRSEQETFFRELLGDVEEPTAPFGLLDARADGASLGEAHLALDASLGRRLRAQARALGVSAAAVCHLAWAQVLARVSGREDVVFGTVLFGRMRSGAGADRALGLFINTLPVRIRLGSQPVREAVRATHVELAQLLRHELAPLALAQRCSGVAAPTPLFSALFNYRHASLDVQAAALEGIEVLSAEEHTNYPLVLSVNDLGDRFGLSAQAQRPLQAERVCELMHVALERLLDALEQAPDTAAAQIDVLPDSERALLLEGWNATGTGYPRDRCVHELFEAWAHQTPDAVAVEYDGQALSYGELNARANRMAHYLLRHGVGAETLVVLCLPRGLEMVVATLGILKAGGAYVPLDPEYPAARLRFMLEDTGAPVLLTQASLRERLPRYDGRVVCVDAQWEEIGRESEADPKVAVGSRNLAYVIYTSGSTGTPKGTCVEHRSIVRLVRDSDYIAITPADRFAQASVVSFDAATFELWGALLNGARAIGVGRELSLSGREFGEFLRTREITVLFLTTALFNQMAREAPGAFGSLRCLLFGGEMVDAEAVRAVLRDGAPRELLHVYGPTEVTTFSTWYRVSALAQEARTVPIGRPIANTTAYVLNGHLQPVPVGVPGELYLGGDGLARGYLKRPELTAERFVEHPFSAEAGARLYRTGDLVRRLGDGNIEFLGRQDGQVKVRGFRIELGEIEAVLLRHPAVRQAVAMVREDVPGDKRVVAYVVNEPEAPADVVEQLRAEARASLPGYMLPSIVMLDALPLTPNGKVNREALPAPEGDRGESGYVAPRTPSEEMVARIWAEVLDLDRVGVEDNFFELGGHSLLATQVVSRVCGELDLAIPLKALFEAPTLSGFTDYIATLDWMRQARSAPDDAREAEQIRI